MAAPRWTSILALLAALLPALARAELPWQFDRAMAKAFEAVIP